MSQTTFWLFRPPLRTLCAHHVSFFNEGKKNSEALSGAEISLKDKESFFKRWAGTRGKHIDFNDKSY